MIELTTPKYRLHDGFDMPLFLKEVISLGLNYEDIKVEKNWETFSLYIFASKKVENAD